MDIHLIKYSIIIKELKVIAHVLDNGKAILPFGGKGNYITKEEFLENPSGLGYGAYQEMVLKCFEEVEAKISAERE
ncbi:MAG: hypothetical protein AAF620_00345 [Bacteroidota bacterium]